MNTTMIDCTGLNCPLPILRLKKAVDDLNIGETLEMIATDPGSIKDVAAWSKQTGHVLLGSTESDGRFVFMVQKSH
ncbi:MAG: sulfurtransferase TusA family protein [Acidiferrobacter sp.]